MNLSYGSRGDEVRKLQEALNSHGYGLSVDGIFGVKTQAAVRDYQSKNGLGVDGIAGVQTQGRLYGSGGSAAGTAAPPISGLTQETAAGLKTTYAPSKNVETARKKAETVEAAAPTAPDLGYLDAAWQQLQGLGSFSYDLEKDPLYGQYAAMYQRWGREAMEDTMGQAAALTGGYGSSYAQTAGSQAYGAWMQDLGALAPEFYDRALAGYQAERGRRTDAWDAALSRASMDYGSYRDRMSDWQADRSAARSGLERAEDLSYQEYQDLLDYWLQRAKLENADYQWRQEYQLRQMGL